MFVKRVVAAVVVAAFSVVGVAPAADAAPIKKPVIQKAIDWD